MALAPLQYQVSQNQTQKDKLLGNTTTPTSTPTNTPSQTQTTSYSNGVLGVGSRGDQVKLLQQKLGITADGIFGSQTQKAVTDYQKANGLTVDGLVGTQTWGKLNGTATGGGAGTGGGNNNQTTTPTSTPQEDMARNAAAAGLSVSEYQNLSNNSSAPSQEELDSIANELGIPSLEASAYARPSKTSQQIYDEAYATSGLGELKAKVNALNEDLKRERAALTEALGTVDENPFLDERARVGRGRVVMDQAEKRINNIIDQISRVQDLYKTGVDEINNIVTRNQNDFTQNQANDQAKLNYLLKKAETKASTLTTKKAGDATKNANAYLSGIEPKLVGTSETGYFRYDPVTKKYVSVINGQSSSASTKMTAAEVEQDSMNKVRTLFSPGYTVPDTQGVPFIDSNGYATPQGWKTALNASGMTRKDFIMNFGDLVYRGNIQAYGLTPVEGKLITGEIKAESGSEE